MGCVKKWKEIVIGAGLDKSRGSRKERPIKRYWDKPVQRGLGENPEGQAWKCGYDSSDRRESAWGVLSSPLGNFPGH